MVRKSEAMTLSTSNLKSSFSNSLSKVAGTVSRLYTTLTSHIVDDEFKSSRSNIKMQLQSGGLSDLRTAQKQLITLSEDLENALLSIHERTGLKKKELSYGYSTPVSSNKEYESSISKLDEYVAITEFYCKGYDAFYTFCGGVAVAYESPLDKTDLVMGGRNVKVKPLGRSNSKVKEFIRDCGNKAIAVNESNCVYNTNFEKETVWDILDSQYFLIKDDFLLEDESDIKDSVIGDRRLVGRDVYICKAMTTEGLIIYFVIKERIPLFETEEQSFFSTLDFESIRRFKRSLKEQAMKFGRNRLFNETIDFNNLELEEESPLISEIHSGIKNIYQNISDGKISLSDVDTKLFKIANATAQLNILIETAKIYFSKILIDDEVDGIFQSEYEVEEFLLGYLKSLNKKWVQIGRQFRNQNVLLKTSIKTNDIEITATQKFDEPLDKSILKDIYLNSGKFSTSSDGRRNVDREAATLVKGRGSFDPEVRVMGGSAQVRLSDMNGVEVKAKGGEGTGPVISDYAPARAKWENNCVVFVADSDTYDLTKQDKMDAKNMGLGLPGKITAVAKIIISQEGVTIKAISSAKSLVA